MNEPEPLWDPERHRRAVHRRGRHLRHRRSVLTTLGASGVVVMLLGGFALTNRQPSSRQVAAVASGTPTAPSTTASTSMATHTANAGTASDAATVAPPAASTVVPDDGRLHRPYVPVGYRLGDGALSSFRVDPAPDDMMPTLSQAEALRSFEASDVGSSIRQAGTSVVVRFGLFSGSVSNPPAPDHTLTGTNQVQAVPAWLVVIDGVQFSPSGPGAAGPAVLPGDTSGVPTVVATTMPIASVAGAVVSGYAITVIADPGGQFLTGLMITGGGSAAQRGIG